MILFILMISCSQKKTDNRIMEFESVFNERQINAINLLVKDFDNNLNNVYPNLKTEQAYEQFLIEIKNGNIDNWEKYRFQSKLTNSEFIESGLKDEIYSKEYKELEINYAGKYMKALKVIKNSDSLISGYYDVREIAGFVSPVLFASGILISDPDFSDYIHKRIVVLEFSY